MVIALLEYSDLFLCSHTARVYLCIMLALCLILSGSYYAKNYAGIIGPGPSWYTLYVNFESMALLVLYEVFRSVVLS